MIVRQAPALRLLCRHAQSKTQAAVPRLIRNYTSILDRKWSTPLAKDLAAALTTTGPVSIAKFMRQCLTSPDGGYYTTRPAAHGKDQFGKTGDFVTSPEISQIFGELIGIWFLTEWMSQGQQSSGVQLVELGPGRGTLMDDVLRTISKFEPMAQAIDTIYLVEASELLAGTQKQLLCGDKPLEDHPLGRQCRSKHLPHANIVWLEETRLLQRDYIKTPFIVAHEFFDALPIYTFQSVTQPMAPKTPSKHPKPTAPSHPQDPQTRHERPENEWRELLVSLAAPPSIITLPSTPNPKPRPEFELSLSPSSTWHSRLLTAASPRYAALLPTAGSTIEISPDSQEAARNLTTLISASPSAPPNSFTMPHPDALNSKPEPNTKPVPTGAALIIDYGPTSTIPVSTLRGTRNHARVSPFADPGHVDITADVDFGALVDAALAAAPDVEVHGPIEQADWLAAMGGQERCDMLVKEAEAAGEDGRGNIKARKLRERVEGGWRRLTDRGPNGMGRLYKVMTIVPESDGTRRPVGFGGHVMGSAA